MDVLAALLELAFVKPDSWTWGRHFLTLGVWMTPVLVAGAFMIAMTVRH
jgi:hypothetical protein